MPGTNAVSGDSFGCYNEGRNGAPIISYVEAKDAATQDKELIGSKINSAEIEKPCFTSRLK